VNSGLRSALDVRQPGVTPTRAPRLDRRWIALKANDARTQLWSISRSGTCSRHRRCHGCKRGRVRRQLPTPCCLKSSPPQECRLACGHLASTGPSGTQQSSTSQPCIWRRGATLASHTRCWRTRARQLRLQRPCHLPWPRSCPTYLQWTREDAAPAFSQLPRKLNCCTEKYKYTSSIVYFFVFLSQKTPLMANATSVGDTDSDVTTTAAAPSPRWSGGCTAPPQWAGTRPPSVSSALIRK
jgi:hypothetical protein